jgi:hypothetical protein
MNRRGVESSSSEAAPWGTGPDIILPRMGYHMRRKGAFDDALRSCRFRGGSGWLGR